MVTIEKRGNNSYRLVVSCGYDINGKKILKRKTLTLPVDLTEKEIERELTIQGDKFEKEVLRGTYLDGNITLNEFADKWFKDYAEINLKPKTFIHYKNLLERILIALGHKKLDSIQPTHLLEFYKNLSESKIRLDYKYKLKENIISAIPDFGDKIKDIKIHETTVRKLIKGGNTTKDIAEKISKCLKIPISKLFDAVGTDKKLSSMTISHYHKLISAMLTTAVQWQLIISNPAERIKPPKVMKKEAKYYDIDEVNQMLALLETEPLKYKVMIHIVIFCGLRLAELTALEWSDIDFEKETISISKQLQYIPELGMVDTDNTKSESGNRIISIPPMLVDLLQECKVWQDSEKVKLGDKWVETNKLFTQENGERIFPDTPSKWFHKFVKKNNLPSLTFHQIRHTNASLLISQNVDIATVANRLGHADKAITLRTYTHAIKEQDREASDKLQTLLKKKKD